MRHLQQPMNDGDAMLYAGIASGIFFLWAVITYNRLISLRRFVWEAWSGISVQLKRRHDLIPNLVEVVKAYAAHESELFEDIARIRASAEKISADKPSEDLALSEGRVTSAVARLFAVSEAYPVLRASENFIHLHEALYDAEEQLQMARRYYNGTVRKYMILCESFPSLLVAKLFSFTPEAYFTLSSDAEKVSPKVDLS